VTHDVGIDCGRSRPLPRGLGISAVSVAGESIFDRVIDISFAPDGSSNGAHIELGEYGLQRLVVVDWLTRRVRIDDTR
jgi:hypothetical protein